MTAVFNAGDLIDERYRIISLIGQGGMAYVYRAEDVRMGRQVAVKVLKESAAARRSAVADFRREARAAAGLSHPNIVAAYDIVDSGDIHYIVMELVEGVTLKNYIAQKGVLTNEEVLSIAAQTASGMEAAHKKGIIHRDIKPHNIIISQDGRIKITDFGIALAADAGPSSRRGDVLGSVHYIAPEQVRRGIADERTDIYSLGISMYEMITGRLPYDSENDKNILIAHMEDALVPPSVYNKEIYPALNDIIIKATRKAPEERYQKVRDLINDLDRAYSDPKGHFVELFGGEERSGSSNERGKAVSTSGSGEDAADPGAKGGTGGTAAMPPDKRAVPTDGTGTGAGMEEQDAAGADNTVTGPPDIGAHEDNGASGGGHKGSRLLLYLLAAAVLLALIILALFELKRHGDRQVAMAVQDFVITETESRPTQETESGDYTIDIEGDDVTPDLRGLTVEEAESLTASIGLMLDASFEDYSDIYEKGLIINQNPAAGDVLTDGATVYATVSRGSRKHDVLDNLRGLSLQQARETLEEAGQDMELVDEREEFSDEIHEGYVIGYELEVIRTADAAAGTVMEGEGSGMDGSKPPSGEASGETVDGGTGAAGDYGAAQGAETGEGAEYVASGQDSNGATADGGSPEGSAGGMASGAYNGAGAKGEAGADGGPDTYSGSGEKGSASTGSSAGAYSDAGAHGTGTGSDSAEGSGSAAGVGDSTEGTGQQPGGSSEIPQPPAPPIEHVTLIVSLGPESDYAYVPDITGFVVTDAVEILKSEGFGAGYITAVNNGEYDENQIEGQSIAPGTFVKKGTLLDLTISVDEDDDIPDGTVIYEPGTMVYDIDDEDEEKAEEEEVSPGANEADEELPDSNYYYGSIDTVCSIGTATTGPISSGDIAMVGIRLRQNVDGSTEYTTLTSPIPVEVGEVIPVVFTSIRGVQGVNEGFVEVYNSETSVIYSTFRVDFGPVD